MKKHRQYRSPYKVKKKKPIYKNRFFWLGIFFLILFSSIFYLLFFFQFFQVKNINIEGQNKVSADSIKSLAESKLENKILLFNTKSIFLVRSGEIKEQILSDFPQIAKAEVRRKLPDIIDIKISERVGQTTWCREERCFSLDREGIIFEEIFNVATDTFRICGGAGDKPDLSLGDKITDEDKLSQVLYLESKLRDRLQTSLAEINMVSDERLNVKTSGGWEIYFNPKEDLNWQLDKLSAVLDKEIPSEKRDELEYIELRFGNLASYKYR
ncbi:MAG: FtsQ-type POTRA domain-containing protein [Candidatus Paceibacterota bacterium]